MRCFSRGETFDERPMFGLDSEAIDFRVASESFASVRKLARRDIYADTGGGAGMRGCCDTL